MLAAAPCHTTMNEQHIKMHAHRHGPSMGAKGAHLWDWPHGGRKSARWRTRPAGTAPVPPRQAPGGAHVGTANQGSAVAPRPASRVRAVRGRSPDSPPLPPAAPLRQSFAPSTAAMGKNGDTTLGAHKAHVLARASCPPASIPHAQLSSAPPTQPTLPHRHTPCRQQQLVAAAGATAAAAILC